MKNNNTIVYSFLLLVGDFVSLALAFLAGFKLRALSSVPVAHPISAKTYMATFLAVAPFWLLIFAMLGLYNIRIHDKRFSELGRLFLGCLVGILFVISFGYLTNTTIFPAHLVPIYGVILAFLFVLAFRTFARRCRRELFAYGFGISKVLIVGDTRVTHELIESLGDVRESGFLVLGVVGGVKHPLRQNASFRQFESFGDAMSHFRNDKLTTIMQTELYAAQDRNDEILTYAQQNHIDYSFVPGNSELFVGNIDVDLFHSIPVIAVHQTAIVGWGRVVKRAFDLFFGSLALIISSPLILAVALLEKLFGHGPVFFRQVRLTRFNHKFTVFKFRTQYAIYDGTTPEQAFTKMGKPELIKVYRDNGDFIAHDPRVTRLGSILRKLSLDEIPQVFNVLRGDISLVGPRALIPEELEKYAKKHTILAVKSGLTGLAQVSGRKNISFDERRQLDLFYVQNWNIWSDFIILAKTVWIVINRRGAE